MTGTVLPPTTARGPLPHRAGTSLTERCHLDGHPGHRVVRYFMRNGAMHFCAWCWTCDRNITREVERTGKLSYYPHDTVFAGLQKKGLAVEDLPIVRPDGGLRVCYACSALDHCEDHHVAERAIHGAFADQLPLVALCPKCHRLATNNLLEFMDRLRAGRAR